MDTPIMFDVFLSHNSKDKPAVRELKRLLIARESARSVRYAWKRLEWCSDEYSEEACVRVIRGGGWPFDSQGCRSAYRSAAQPAGRGDDLGFRVAAVPLGQASQAP